MGEMWVTCVRLVVTSYNRIALHYLNCVMSTVHLLIIIYHAHLYTMDTCLHHVIQSVTKTGYDEFSCGLFKFYTSLLQSEKEML
jgi:hypothetical protein